MNSSGIGMGLMICKNLVQKNGGTISVHSDGINKGSIFTFTMQIESSHESMDEVVNSNNYGDPCLQLIREEEERPGIEVSNDDDDYDMILDQQQIPLAR